MLFDSEPSPLMACPGIVNSMCKCCVVSGCNQQRDYIIIIVRFGCGLFIEASVTYLQRGYSYGTVRINFTLYIYTEWALPKSQ